MAVVQQQPPVFVAVRPGWSLSRTLMLVALVLFILDALAFNGNVTGMNAHLLLALGLAFMAAAGAL